MSHRTQALRHRQLGNSAYPLPHLRPCCPPKFRWRPTLHSSHDPTIPSAAVISLVLLHLMGNRASAARVSADELPIGTVRGLSGPMLTDRLRGALWGIFIGDALAMPAHWYYDVRQLRADHGTIKGYTAAKTHLRGSIMNLSNTGGGGRGSDKGSVVGDVILHGKKRFWRRGQDYFYHRDMRAGENTLEAHVTRVLLRTAAEAGKYDGDRFLDAYVSFMTTPGTHNDTYAGTAHRMFFANWANGVPPKDCAANDGHNTDAIDGLTGVPAVVAVALSAGADAPTLFSQVRLHSSLVRQSSACELYSVWFAGLLLEVAASGDMRAATTAWGKRLGLDVPRMVEDAGDEDPMTACYLDSSVPVLLHFAYKYADDPAAGLLASVNAGGENVARGAALGALYGAAGGVQAFPAWARDGLVDAAALQAEIEAAVPAPQASDEL